MLKKLLKNKKGSELVEKILMVAFSVAAGAAVCFFVYNIKERTRGGNIYVDKY